MPEIAKMSITIKDIAKGLNLSKTTVSFVLSGIGSNKGISISTQYRVLQYAREHNYQPNLLAKSLHSGMSHTIGLVVPSIGDLYYAELAKAIEAEAKKRGYLIIICSSERDVVQEVKMIRTLKAKQVDGLIIAPTEHCETELRSLLRENFPFVLIDRYYPSIAANYVVIDDVKTSFELVSHLISQGRRKIALITADTKITAIYLRHEGYRMAVEGNGLEYDPRLHCEVRRNDYSKNTIEVLDRLLEEVPDVDGFYFTTHYLALETITYFMRNNIDPRRYGLACIHQNPIFATIAPGMNVARIPIEDMGAKSIGLLMDNIDDPKCKPHGGCIVDAEMVLN